MKGGRENEALKKERGMKKRGERDGIDFKGGCWGPLSWK